MSAKHTGCDSSGSAYKLVNLNKHLHKVLIITAADGLVLHGSVLKFVSCLCSLLAAKQQSFK
jgi:hypothetical protein